MTAVPYPIVKVTDVPTRHRLIHQLYGMGIKCVKDTAAQMCESDMRQSRPSPYIWLARNREHGFYFCYPEDFGSYVRDQGLTLVNSPAQFMAYGRRHGMLPR